MVLSVVCHMLLLVEGINCEMPTYHSGWASRYAPGVMTEVVSNRIDWGQVPADLSAYYGFVAVNECDRIGEDILIRPQDSRDWHLFLVVDCANTTLYTYDIHTRSWMLTTEWMDGYSILVELSYEMADNWGALNGGFRIDVIWQEEIDYVRSGIWLSDGDYSVCSAYSYYQRAVGGAVR